MNSTDLVELNSLVNKAKDMKNLVKQTEEDSAKKLEIRKYAIDALKDYEDVCNTLVGIINNAREIFNPKFEGKRNMEFHINKQHNLPTHDYTFNTGYFSLHENGYSGNYIITVECENVNGEIIKTFGGCEEKLGDTSGWKAIGISIRDNFSEFSDKKFKPDLLTAYFNALPHKYTLPYTEENLMKYNWNLDGWFVIKEHADNLRARTEKLVEVFKSVVKDITDEYASRVRYVEEKAKPTEYVKVAV